MILSRLVQQRLQYVPCSNPDLYHEFHLIAEQQYGLLAGEVAATFVANFPPVTIAYDVAPIFAYVSSIFEPSVFAFAITSTII